MVYKVILSKASPVFKTMFSESLPQPATDTQHTAQDSRPVVVLDEHSYVLEALLSTIYPPTLPARWPGSGPLSLSNYIAVLDMARRYDMAATSSRLLIDFEGSQALKNNILQAFCAAYSRELREAAEIAARASLKYSLTLDAIGDELQHLDGPAFHMLWKFHRACSAVAVKAISGHKYTWIPKPGRDWWSTTPHVCCKCNKIVFRFGSDFYGDGGYFGHCDSSWSTHISWGKYVDRAVEALKTQPCGEAITNKAILLPSYQAEMCDVCRKHIAGLSEFSRYLGEEVDRVVSNVRERSYLLNLLADLILPFDHIDADSNFKLSFDLIFWHTRSHYPGHPIFSFKGHVSMCH
jgi:hypothetical protein